MLSNSSADVAVYARLLDPEGSKERKFAGLTAVEEPRRNGKHVTIAKVAATLCAVAWFYLAGHTLHLALLCPRAFGVALSILAIGDASFVVVILRKGGPRTCCQRFALFFGTLCALLTVTLSIWIYKRALISEAFSLGPDADISGVVKVYIEDGTGIVHIESSSDDAGDLFFAQGLVMAQTRTFQMEFQRRLARGQLAEVAGAAAVPQDTLFRTLGFGRVAEQTYARMREDPRFEEEILNLGRFCDGVNHFFTSQQRFSAPLELILLSFLFQTPFPWQLEPWTPADSIAWVLVMSYGLSGNLQREMMRFKLIADQGLSVDRVNELLPAFDLTDFPTILQPEDVCQDPHTSHDNATCMEDPEMKAWLNSLRATQAGSKRDLAKSSRSVWDFRPGNALGISGASNNWVVSGDLSQSGAPLLANDPHLELTAPNVWLLMHLKDPAQDVNVIGACFLGVPFVVLGRNAHLAWGVTNTGADVQDLFVLQTVDSGSAYMHNGSKVLLQTRTESLGVAGESALRRVAIRTAPHYGPVISDHNLPDTILRTRVGDAATRLGNNTVALRWTSLLADEPEHFDTTLVAFMRMCRARTIDEARTDALKYLVAPGQNFVMATHKDIAYQMTGRFPMRVKGHTGVFPVPGNGSYDWGAQHYFAFEDLPWVKNPKQGFVATANNRVQPPCFPLTPTCDFDSTDGYRAKRITELLAHPQGKHSVASMQAVQQDVSSLYAAELQEVLAEACRQSNAPEAVDLCDLLVHASNEDWKSHRMKVSSVEASLFNLWNEELVQSTQAETGVKYWTVPLFTSFAFRRAAANGTKDVGSVCAQNMSDADCLSYATAALERVALLLAEGKVKPWGTVGMHETCFASQLFAGTPLDCLFSRRVPHGGDDVTVNVGSSSYPSFEQRAGSSFRAVMSMGKDASGDDGASVIVNALGQSGSPFSRHYDNMVQPWSLGEYFAMSLKNATANGPVRESCLASDRELCSP